MKKEEVRPRNISGYNRTPCFYCLGDRPAIYGSCSDMIVLYITERASSIEEALCEFEEYEKNIGERMRLNVILNSNNVTYFDRIV